MIHNFLIGIEICNYVWYGFIDIARYAWNMNHWVPRVWVVNANDRVLQELVSGKRDYAKNETTGRL